MARCRDCFSIRPSYVSLREEGDGKCSNCYGTGLSHYILDQLVDSFADGHTTCPVCNGSSVCQTCGGSGLGQDEEDQDDNNRVVTEITEEREDRSDTDSGYSRGSEAPTIESHRGEASFGYDNYSGDYEDKSRFGGKPFLFILIIAVGTLIYYFYMIQDNINYNNTNTIVSIVDSVIDGLNEVQFSGEWKMYGEDISQAIDVSTFRSAYKRAIAQLPKKVWDENKSWLTLQNILSSRNRLLSTSFGKFVYMSGCKPHSCIDSWIKIIFSPIDNSIVIWVVVYNHGSWTIGDNSVHMRILLKTMETIQERRVILPVSPKERTEIKASFRQL